MRLTVKLKLLLLAALALFSLAVVVGVSEVIGRRQQVALDDAEQRLIPRLEIGPLIDAEFVKLRQGIQDAVSAQDSGALESTMANKTRIFDLINGAGEALQPSLAASLRWAVQDYFETARSVSRRLISGETGEDIVEGMRDMQDRQRRAEAAIRSATGLDRAQLKASFAVARQAASAASRLRLTIGVLAVVSVFALWFWASREVLRALNGLSEGFRRFEQGELTHAIPVRGNDELGDVTRDANRMATSLHRLEQQRNREDWIKGGIAELSARLQGSLAPATIAEKSLSLLIEKTRAVAGALYLDDGHGRLESQYVHSGRSESQAQARSLAKGEGLVGQAFVDGEIRIVSHVPFGHFPILSGLGESAPATIVLVPLFRGDRGIGVVELALFDDLEDQAKELLHSTRTPLAIAFEAAIADRAQRELLHETQRQAERLAAQEEELRVSNRELLERRRELESANEELEAQKRALAERNSEIELARERIQEKAEELGRVSLYKSQFLANMSHELRTPLNSMLLLSHLMAENEGRNLTLKQVEYCTTIHSAGQDLLALINQVLDLSKIEAGKQEVDLERVEVVGFSEHARHIFGPLAKQKGLRFVVHVAPLVPAEIVTDRKRVERILTNLIGNAIKFTEQGEVSLRIERPTSTVGLREGNVDADAAVAFVVSDSGIGIAAAEQERVFAAFEQIEAKSDRRYQGTGLGLAIARESALLLGGDIRLESEVGRGSTFTLVLPRGRIEDYEPSPRARRVEPSPPSTHLEPYVLVIEDDAVLGDQLASLVEARGLTARVAHSGLEGLRLAEDKPPRGIILDVRLPDIDGWSVMERLQANPRTASVPVHFLSALDAEARGLSLGAVGYQTKPASRAELGELVRRLVPDGDGSQPRILVVEDSALEARSILALLATQGIAADHATRGADARVKLEREKYGCIILDLGLPDVDGLGLLDTLKPRLEANGTRVIVHTGRALTKSETRRLEGHAQAIVLKDGDSAARLLEEVRLFVHHIGTSIDKAPGIAETSLGHDSSLEGRKILVVEDDMRTVYSVSALLRSRGSQVIIAENGQEGLDALAANPDIDLVLMDVMMPGMDGYEATRKLRTDPRFEGLPVIVLTAKAMSGERERCLEAGASDYLSKPVDSRSLLAMVGKHLPQRSANG